MYDLAREVIPHVISITARMLDDVRALLDTHRSLMARDALHAAVYRSIKAEALYSYDWDFDRINGIVRREPPKG